MNVSSRFIFAVSSTISSHVACRYHVPLFIDEDASFENRSVKHIKKTWCVFSFPIRYTAQSTCCGFPSKCASRYATIWIFTVLKSLHLPRAKAQRMPKPNRAPQASTDKTRLTGVRRSLDQSRDSKLAPRWSSDVGDLLSTQHYYKSTISTY